jgi:putative spermidine/putrescine transport system substrate-binding protein
LTLLTCGIVCNFVCFLGEVFTSDINESADSMDHAALDSPVGEDIQLTGYQHRRPSMRDPESASADADENDALTGSGKRSKTLSTVGNATMWLLWIGLCAGVLVLISVTSATYNVVLRFHPTTTVTTVYEALGLPGHEGLSWNDVTTQTSGTTVNFYMWSGDTKINKWVDDWLAPKVSDLYSITVQRVAVDDTEDAVSLVLAEIAAGNLTTGKVDLVWINGENFATMKSANALYGLWTTKVPAAANYDFNSNAVKYDFGITTNGYEMPYNLAQVVFIYDTKRFPSGPPQSMAELVTWVQENPGKFTYPAPCQTTDCEVYDYTGSAFIRHFLYEFGPTGTAYTDMLGAFDETVYEQRAGYAFTKLRQLYSGLYNVSGKNYYPVSINESDALFASEDIWLTLSYEPSHAGDLVSSGYWPNTTMSYVPSSGTISNTNFVAIASNAENALSAVVVADYIAEIWSTFSRRQSDNWGSLQAYDPTCDAMTTGGWQIAFDSLTLSPQTPSQAVLSAGAMPEMVSEYVTTMQSDWVKCVLEYSDYQGQSPCVVG